MAEAQEIHARLERMTLPIGRLELETEIEGIFCFPDEWKTTDEANPGLFTYTAKFCTSDFTGGKIQPRKQTERELREAEEASKKKTGKKDGKQDAAEEQRIRKQKELDAEEDRKRQEEFEKLPQSERQFFNSEDPYKSASLKFEKNKDKIELTGGLLVVFEERVIFDKGEWIYIYKYPVVSEDELAKLRKGKPKNLNLNDLNPITMRAWVDYSKFSEGNVAEVRVRCPLKQIDETADTSKPNLEKTYILVKLTLNQNPARDHDEHELTSKDLIKPPPAQPPVPLDIESVNELQEQIRLALQSIAMEYSSAFWKELNFLEEQKNINTLAVPKKTDINKRKEQFLYDFNMTGKYRILKERLKKVIVKVCKYKYAGVLSGATSFTGVTTEAKDQFYSELYNFLVSTTQTMLDKIVDQKKEELGVTTVPSVDQQTNKIQEYVKERLDESAGVRASRFAAEYEDIRDTESAKEIYNKMMEREPDNVKLKKEYIKFCLRNRIGTPQKLASNVYDCLRVDRESTELQELYCYLLMSTKKKLDCRQAWVLLNEMLNQQPNSVKLLTLCGFLFGTLMGEENLGQKYTKLAERIQLRELNPTLPKVGTHSTEPIPAEVPTQKNVCEYNLSLKDAERDELVLAIMRDFASYNLFGLVQALLPRIKNKDSDELALLGVRTELFKGNAKLALEKSIEAFQRSPSLTTAQLTSQIAFQQKNYQVAEEYLKKCLKYPEVANCPAVYIQLACLYFDQKKWGNSKACLVKLLEHERNYCLAWLKLGLTELQLGNNEAAVNCLREANLLNPNNSEVWLALAEGYCKLHSAIIANQCLIAYNRIQSTVQFCATQKHTANSASKRHSHDQQVLSRLKTVLKTEHVAEDEQQACKVLLRTLEHLTENSSDS